MRFFSFILALASSGGILDAFIRFVVLQGSAAGMRTRIYDVGIGALSLLFIVSSLLLSIEELEIGHVFYLL